MQTTPRDVYDVTGAGDVVVAVFGLFLIGGFDLVKAATLANIAAGVEVSKKGAAVHRSVRKVMAMEQLLAELACHREAGRRICFVSGRFHPRQICSWSRRMVTEGSAVVPRRTLTRRELSPALRRWTTWCSPMGTRSTT